MLPANTICQTIRISRMPVYCIALLVTLFVSTCGLKADSDDYAVSISRVLPVNITTRNGKVVIDDLKTTESVFVIGNYCISRLLPTRVLETNEDIKETEPYFIRRINERDGFLFRSADDRSRGERLHADSFMFINGLKTETADFPSEQDGYRSGTAEDPVTSSHIEKFSPRGKPGQDTEPDTLYYFFSKKMSGLKYTLSKKLDSLTGMKLYKIVSFYKEGYSEQKKMLLPAHEISVEILPIEPILSDREKALLEHFKKVN